MSDLMTLKEQQHSTAALRSQLAAGIPIADAAARMVRLQPGRAQWWAEAASQLRLGKPLSHVIGDVWPPASVSAVRAGEDTGVLVDVLEQLSKSVALKRRLLKSASRIIYPVGIMGGAFVIFVSFLLTIVPMIAQQTIRASGRVGDPDGIAGFGLRMRVLLVDHWIVAAVLIGAAIVGLVLWLRAPQTRAGIVRALLAAPLFGEAFRFMSFGLWAEYMALSSGAGLPTIDSLATTADVLPEPLQAGVRALEHDLKHKHVPLSVASDPDQQGPTDPRRDWPFYLTHAFAVGESTGRLDVELRRVSPELIEAGEEAMQRALSVANFIAILGAAILVGSTMLLVYLPMLRNLSNLH